MIGKTVIITGANSGIGKETASDLARRGARVIMACRNIDISLKVKDEIIGQTGNEDIVVMQLDLSSFKSIRDFADKIIKTESRLDVLIHNAGYAGMFKNFISIDGIELTMATNHYGPFLLTHLLINLMLKSAPSRIIIVASQMYIFGHLNPESRSNLNPTRFFFPAHTYSVSKFANILFTLELAHRLKGTQITANVVHPGTVDTGIYRNIIFPFNIPFILTKSCFKTPKQGAQTTIYAATSNNLSETTGEYLYLCKVKQLNSRVKNKLKAKIFWEASSKIVKLSCAEQLNKKDLISERCENSQ